MLSNHINNRLFKKFIIIFWTVWWLSIVWTDAVSALAHLQLLKTSWAPDKYSFFVDSLKAYHPSAWIPAFLYFSVIFWSLIATLLFVWVCFSLRNKDQIWIKRAQAPFIVSLSLWLALFIADQIIMRYDIENLHMIQGGFQLLSFLSIYVLPNDDETN